MTKKKNNKKQLPQAIKFYADLGLQHLPASYNKITNWPYEPWQVSASANSEPITKEMTNDKS